MKKVIIFSVDEKDISFHEDDLIIKKAVSNTSIVDDPEVTTEESLSKISTFKLLKYLFYPTGKTRRRFKIFLSDTIKYALLHHNDYRGIYASDVMLFEHYFGDIIKWKENK